MKTAQMLNDKTLIIRFSYDPAVVTQVRCLPQGRRWVPEIKAWTCPASIDALTQLREWGFEIGADVAKWEQDFLHPSKPTIKPVNEIAGLKGKLYPFQAEGVGFIKSRGGHVLLADEMGLGKTIQTLAYLQNNSQALPAIIVCPASLKNLWEAECKKWTILTPEILSGSTPHVPLAISRRDSILIINYNVLGDWLDILKRFNHTVVLDECHYCKSAKAKRTKAVKELCKTAQHVIALSGTPIINRPVEFYNILNILAPSQFNKFWTFAQRYCDAKHNGYGWDFNGASNTEELHNRINGSVMLRRLKSEVLKELPDKTKTTIPISLNGNAGLYGTALREAGIAWSQENEKPDQLKDITQISHLRQAAVEAKFDACCEWISNFLETGRKLIIFDVHHKTTDKLLNKFPKAITLDGRVDARLRSKVVERFQTDPEIQLLVGNIQVAGTGHTLTAASDVVFMELPWTPAELNQSSDRVHRIGQKEAVNIYYLIAQGTLEEDMAELLAEKEKVLDSVLDGKTTEKGNILPELLRRLKEKTK